MATTRLDNLTTDLDDFPATHPGVPRGPQSRSMPKTTGVHLDPEEEAELFGLVHPADHFFARTFDDRSAFDGQPTFDGRSEAELDADWAEYDAWQAAMSRWINRGESGPQPY